MGVQIFIEADVMFAAGWRREQRSEPAIIDHETGETLYPAYSESIWTHPDHKQALWSYDPVHFSADCNAWGSNRALFKDLGLFYLYHLLA